VEGGPVDGPGNRAGGATRARADAARSRLLRVSARNRNAHKARQGGRPSAIRAELGRPAAVGRARTRKHGWRHPDRL
jgi:hypothetical protein